MINTRPYTLREVHTGTGNQTIKLRHKCDYMEVRNTGVADVTYTVGDFTKTVTVADGDFIGYYDDFTEVTIQAAGAFEIVVGN